MNYRFNQKRKHENFIQNYRIFFAFSLFRHKAQLEKVSRSKEKIEQDLGTVFRCNSLGSLFKILSCEFFFMGWKCIFKLSSHMAES